MFTPSNLFLTTVIVLLLVGTKKIRGMGEDLGTAVKNFREALQGNREEKKETAEASQSSNVPPKE